MCIPYNYVIRFNGNMYLLISRGVAVQDNTIPGK